MYSVFLALKEEADSADTPARVCDCIYDISMAWMRGDITEEQNHELVFGMYKRFYEKEV